MPRLEDVILRDTRALQPAATAVSIGTLYCVDDEPALPIERSTGTVWEAYGTAGGTGGPSAVQGSFLVSGGQVAWQSALIFAVSAAGYYIGGTHYASAAGTATLGAAHATLDRIDVIAVNTSSAVVVIAGTAAATPSEPDVDPATQLKLGIVFIAATATQPTVTDTALYAENTGPAAEWTWTTSGSGFSVAGVTNPRTGTYCIEGTTVANAAYAQGAAAAPITLTAYARLVFYLRSKAAWANNRVLRVQFLLAGVLKGTPLTVASGYWGFDSSITSGYQLISIPLAQFGIASGTTIDQLRIVDSGGSIGFYIDDVSLQSGGTTEAAPSGLTQDQADARYAALVHAARHKSAGSDPIKLDELAATTDVTTLNASTTAHGLLLKLSNNAAQFLTGVGTWATPAGAGDVVGPASAVTTRIATYNGTTGKLLADGGKTLAEVASDALTAATAIKLDDFAAPDDNTDLNASTTKHGLLLKLPNNAAQFLTGVGTWATPAGAGDVAGPASSVDAEIALFDSTTGKLLKRATGTGFAKLTSGVLSAASVTGSIGITLINPTTGIKGDLEVPFACTITAVRLFGNAAGSIVIDIWKDTYANFPPDVADTITASAKPTLSGAAKSEDATLTGWTTAIAAGNILRFNVDSVSGLTRATLQLTVTRTT